MHAELTKGTPIGLLKIAQNGIGEITEHSAPLEKVLFTRSAFQKALQKSTRQLGVERVKILLIESEQSVQDVWANGLEKNNLFLAHATGSMFRQSGATCQHLTRSCCWTMDGSLVSK